MNAFVQKNMENLVHIINSEDLNVQVYNKMMTPMYRNHRHQIQLIKGLGNWLLSWNIGNISVKYNYFLAHKYIAKVIKQGTQLLVESIDCM
jgi:hypothetical protein